MYTNLVRRGLGILAVFLLTCGAAAAQSISGVVKDTSDSVLPGVTEDGVEAVPAPDGQHVQGVAARHQDHVLQRSSSRLRRRSCGHHRFPSFR